VKNKAKCRLCKSVLESLTVGDYVTCACGEIAIWGGDYELNTYAKNYDNFLRIDDKGNEVVVKFYEKPPEGASDKEDNSPKKDVTKDELMQTLDATINSLENLPPHGKSSFVMNMDLCAVLVCLRAILRRC